MLFSPFCLLCKASETGEIGICDACLQSLPWHTEPHCLQCGLPAPNQLCGKCLQDPPPFDATHACFRYEFPLGSMLQRYKYSELLHLADTFAALMLTTVQQATLPDLIIPMPLHPQRLKERGFNQSIEIARILANQLGVTLDTQACERVRLSPPQASLPYKERIKNMKGAFTCHSDLSGKRIALIDDVMTTGASLDALAKAVKQAGAAHVECWTIARTLPN